MDPRPQHLWRFEPSSQTLAGERAVRAGRGWRITSERGGTIPLFELSAPQTEPGALTYRAFLAAVDLKGRAYPELVVRLAGGGERVDRAANRALSGTSDWAGYEVTVYLLPEERADRVQLNLVFEGSGTLGVKDVELRLEPASE